MKTRVDMKEAEIVKGDPAEHVIGKKEEQSARIHRPAPKRKITIKTITADIIIRKQELEPLVKEYKMLVDINAAFDKVMDG